MYKKGEEMKKFRFVLALILLISTIFCFGCDCKGPNAKAENSYVVSIYKTVRELNDDFVIVTTDYKLWKSSYVVKSKMYELPEADNDEYGYYEHKGRYSEYKCENRVYILPNEDVTFFVNQREEKTVEFIYNGKNVTGSLNKTSLDFYNENFVNTYNEYFFAEKIWGVFGEYINSSKKICIYADKEKTKLVGEAYKDPYFNYIEGHGFYLLESRTLYVDFVTL